MAFIDYSPALHFNASHMPVRRQRWANRLFAAVVAVVLASAVPLGANRDWLYLPIIFTLSLLIAGWAVLYASDGGRALPAPRFHRLLPAALLYGLFLLWGWLQTQAWLPQQWLHPLWRSATDTLAISGASPRATIALNPDLTLQSLLRFTSYAAVFTITAIMATRRKTAERLLLALALAGCAYAAYGLVVYATGNDWVVWVEKYAYPANLTSTFINRNSYAAFAGMGLLCLSGVLLHQLRGESAASSSYEWSRAWRNMVRTLFLPRTMVILAGMLLILTALLLTSSRAGIASSLLAVAVCMAFGIAKRLPGWLKFTAAAVVLVVAGSMMLNTESETVLRYAATDFEKENRLPVYRLVGQAIFQAPWVGHGLGNFKDAFPLYRDSTVHGYYDKAHSDYLEMLFDVGIVGALLLYGALAWVLYGCWKATQKRGRSRIYALVALCTALLMGLHSLVDFSLQMPANAWWFAAVLGLGYSPHWKPVQRRQKVLPNG